MNRTCIALCLSFLLFNARAGTADTQDHAEAWTPGTVVHAEEISRRPIGEWFRIAKIPDDVFRKMQGRSYRKGCPVPREDLRYLTVLHYGADGRVRRGEMIVHRSVAGDVLDVLRELFEDVYPIERMTLIDAYDGDDERSMAANNSSAFNCRFVTGSKTLSKHAEGRAVDLNPLYNPYVRRRGGTLHVEPEAGRPFADRSGIFPFRIDSDDLAVKLFKARGWTWGGDWRSLKDYQHFEKRR